MDFLEIGFWLAVVLLWFAAALELRDDYMNDRDGVVE